MRTRTIALAGLALAVAACGGDDTQAEDTTTTTAGTTTTAAAPAAEVTVSGSSLGEILVDPDGMTIYGFTVDDPGVSNCYDECEDAWPPVPGDTPVSDDVDPSLVSTHDRTDGTSQLVIGDFPVYLFAGDTAAGQTNGQGVQDVWFVIDASGGLVGMPDASDGDSTASEEPMDGITVSDTDLGPTVVDADGRTLYGFTNDTATSSVCNDACADNWPAVGGDTAVGDGIDESLTSTITRDDGSTQLVLGDWPLYRFAGDAAAGDTNGQGVGGVWFVIGPDGTLYR